ncbi:hypothetical protein R1flu_002674 [Riccia fluitans]|uniref:Uncharacterized protein n=1 Tax=Riccia fluitans TaxID=41844 RepID=A0ABD1Y6T7_9MARC
MGIFRKKRLPKSEAAMAEAADLGPIHMQLDGHRLTFGGGEWQPEYEELPEGKGAVEAELLELRREKRKMKKDLEKYQAQKEEMKELKERWNLLDFKYQLLLDMWTMRELDIKRSQEEVTSKRTRHSAA